MKEVTIYRELKLKLPEGQLADWDVYDYWEKERFDSMQGLLSAYSTVYDVGTEHGWLAALFAKYLNLELVMIEPTPEFWPNIKQIFEANNLTMPKAMYPGFASSVGNDSAKRLSMTHWPPEANGEILRDGMPYRYLHNDSHLSSTPITTLDTIYEHSGIRPDALNIDVEGAELEVLRGAAGLLDEVRPLVWVSVHPDLMERDYQTTVDDLKKFMDSWDYSGEVLAVDHEHHYLFTPFVQ